MDSFTKLIDHFLVDFLPNLSQEESDFILEIVKWDREKQRAFKVAKGIFESEEHEDAYPEVKKRRKKAGEE